MSVNGETEDFDDSEIKGSHENSFEYVNSENKKLRIELERISGELNARKRELEIEAALEKVRAKAMGMQISGDLRAVVVILYEQLRDLGFEWGVASIIIMDADTGDLDWWMEGFGDGYVLPERYHVPYFDHQGHIQQLEHWKSGTPYAEIEFSGQEKKNYDAYYFFKTDFSKAPEQTKQLMMQHESVRFSMAFMKYGALSWSPTPLSENQSKIMVRFAKVFEQCYTRFLDLQKAEAQAREAQIEAALERVRSRAMAMHSSHELKEVAQELRKQMGILGQKDLETCAIHLYEESVDYFHSWAAVRPPQFEGEIIESEVTLPKKGGRLVDEMLNAYFSKKQEYVLLVDGEMADEWFALIRKHFPETIDLIIESRSEIALNSNQGYPFYFSFADFRGGSLVMVTYGPPDEVSRVLLARFANVFGIAYRRFSDLQKAEAQAREAKIESALEKIRSRSLAMHHSGELREIIAVFFEKLKELKVLIGTVGIALFDHKTKDIFYWVGNSIQDPQLVSAPFDPVIMKEENFISHSWKAMLEKTEMLNVVYSKKQKNSYFEHLFAHNDKIQIPESAREVLRKMESHLVCFFPSTHSGLFVDSWEGKTYSEEDISILRRAMKVFEQAYIRFLDLQKAETQAREAKIEAALERVRSRSLAMHHSDELKQVVLALSERLSDLGLALDGTLIFVPNSEKRKIKIWISTNQLAAPLEVNLPYDTDIKENAIWNDLWNSIEKRESALNKSYSGKTKDDYFKYVQKYNSGTIPPAVRQLELELPNWSISYAAEKNSLLAVDSWSGKLVTEEEFQILNRFARVFEQAYTRFLDLQKAEVQAREAQIEAALERVRARSMAMHTSSELIETAELLFDQLKQLGAESQGVAFAICDKENPMVQKWTSIGVFSVPYTYEAGEQRMYEAWKNQTEIYEEVYEGERLRNYYELFMEIPGFRAGIQKFIDAGNPLPEWQKNHAIPFKHGYLLLITTKPFEETYIFTRFAKVFEQTYTRFLDLQKAEAQAREATKQASLDRVRGVIASMRSATDLELITPLIFKELTILGVPFIRCGVFIIDEKLELVNAYLSSPEGNSLGVLKLSYHASELTQGTVEAWKRGSVFKQHWNKEDFVQWIQLMMQQDQIQDSKTYQGSAAPPESLDLHFVPFTQGMLYVGAVNPLDEKQLELIQALAKAFSIAYARYEDFVKLESAKSKVESAMKELKATQSQLVQQEKLASLGQLTAGIAHEIKNPLNFVNNFSEVSMELIEEALHQIAQIEDNVHAIESAEILADIKSNLTKIHEHGSRANSIVSSMLQHSRGGSGKKEPTDLNALIKEYVNLSFHGMRAGKNPINVDILLELDPEVKEVSLIKEDFTRVIINLCNNAFDAMRVKVDLAGFNNLSGSAAYQPKLTVRTRSEKDHILIAVEDNGPGIPDEIKDKIFQPFFTTKKGTEGTGLGLSITNDIVKAHGGEIELETQPNAGSNFTINLPTP